MILSIKIKLTEQLVTEQLRSKQNKIFCRLFYSRKGAKLAKNSINKICRLYSAVFDECYIIISEIKNNNTIIINTLININIVK